MRMTGRERLRTTLSHREPDRVPFDLGGSVISGVGAGAYRRLIAKLNLAPRPIRIQSLYSQTAELDEDVLQILDVDTRPTDIYAPDGFEPKLFVRGGYRCYSDEWQITYAASLEGASGYSVVSNPLANATTVRDIEDFDWPDGSDPSRFRGLAEQARYLAQDRNVGVILETDIGGVYEWACWLRGTENFLMDLASDHSMARAVLDKVAEFKIAFWEAALSEAGKYVDLVRESDDMAGQNGLVFSLDTYRELIKPHHRAIFDTIRKQTDAGICLHTCGSVWGLIPDLIDAGVTVLNPVQIGAAKMDPRELKKEYGRDLVFWGGSCDSQRVLPFATPDEVKRSIRASIEELAPGGGYIIAPINMIQDDVPPENILAFAEAVHDYGVY